jgi:ABC-2 type transport system permease protein
VTVGSVATDTAFVVRRTAAGEPLRFLDEVRAVASRSNLLYELVHRDLTVRYKRSAFGILWTMLHPLLLMLIFLVVFSTLFRFQTPHYETYFLSEYIAWNFFAQTTTNAMVSLSWNGPLMKRVPVPPSIFTLSSTISGLVNLVFALVVLFVVMLIAGTPLRPTLILLPVSLLIVGVFTFGVSLALSAVAVFFADLREVYQAAIPALMYLTPIAYPLAIVPERYRWLFKINPLVYILEIVRDPIYYGIMPAPKTFALAVVGAAGSVAFGWMIFRRLAPKFYAQL